MNKISIDVTKIKKEKLRDGKYLDLVQIDFKDGARDKTKRDGSLIESEKSKLVTTGIIKQDGTKEEEDLPIIGETTKWVDKSEVDNFEGIDEPISDDKKIEYPENTIDESQIPF